MKAILVRHGETEYNASGMLQGYAPVPLSARGRQQAMLVGQRLRTVCPVVFYSSDIQRAHETALIISQHVGLPVQPCSGLREWNIGNWINRMADEFYAHVASMGAHPATYVPDGGESQLQTQARMVAQMQTWATQHVGETVLGVSHGMAIDLFVRHIFGLDVMQRPPYRIVNTSVNIFSYADGASEAHGASAAHGQWEVVTLNDISHLEAM